MVRPYALSAFRGILFLLSFALASECLGVHGDGAPPPAGDGHPTAPPESETAGQIFKARCFRCHKRDGVFDPNTFLPPEAKRAEVLKRIQDAGDEHMPPNDTTQLTDLEKKQLTAFLGKAPEPGAPVADACADTPGEPVSDARGKALMRAACVACHGKVDIGATDVLKTAVSPILFPPPDPRRLIRSQHTQFLNNDGSLDQTVVGDDKEITKSQLPENKTTIGRIMQSVASGLMPPRKALMGIHPKLTEGERDDLVTWLGQASKAQGCPAKEWTSIVFVKSQQPVVYTLGQAAGSCGSLGMRVPTIRQLERLQGDFRAGFGGRGCVWSSSLSGDAGMPRYIWSLDGIDGGSGRAIASENFGCKVVCVK